MKYPLMSAAEAAEFINDHDIIGFSGFTASGCPKAVPTAIAERAERFHAEGKPFKIGMYSGASSGTSMDGALARANAIWFRTPYINHKDFRARANSQDAMYFDMHLSTPAQELRYGFLPRPNIAIVEACQLTDDGEIVPTLAGGILPTVCRMADKIIVEINESVPAELRGIHDLYEPKDPPYREALPIYHVSDRCGVDCVKVDPKKIVAVVKTNMPNEIAKFTPLDPVTEKIGENVAKFLETELLAGRIPKEFLPIQSGVGNVANAVMAALAKNPHIPNFEMYTEVIQDSVIDLIKQGRIKAASGCSLTCTPEKISEVFADLEFFKQRVVLRTSEISNHPEIARRLGLITINTAIEADIFGNVNSSHVLGSRLMNGIGGSGDFTRNAYISIFTTQSTAKDGCISAIVPMVSHTDHSEHSVKIIITEHGVADLRGKGPVERAHEIIENCAAPEYRDQLRAYLASGAKQHIPVNLQTAFNMHIAFAETGDMRNAKF